MEPMIVLTVERDGGTREVQGFYALENLGIAVEAARLFLRNSMDSRRAIARIELYNPKGRTVYKE